jgi:hypothetical protein
MRRLWRFLKFDIRRVRASPKARKRPCQTNHRRAPTGSRDQWRRWKVDREDELSPKQGDDARPPGTEQNWLSCQMIRTINEHHRSAKRLFELAKKAALERREKLLKLARGNLMLAKAQLREPALRPDTKLRPSADQYCAIAECLLGEPQMEKRRLLRSLKPRASSFDVMDALVPGLSVRVLPSGQQSFVLIGRFPGGNRRRLGRHGCEARFPPRDRHLRPGFNISCWHKL